MWGVGNRTLYALDVSTPDVGGQGGGVDKISDVIRGGRGGGSPYWANSD